MNEITLSTIWSIVKRWFLLLVVFPALIAGGVAFYEFNYVPMRYLVRTTFHVAYGYQDSIGMIRYDVSGNQYASDYTALMRTPDFYRAVAQSLGEDSIQPGTSIGAAPVTNSRMIDVTVSGGDAAYCMRVAQALVEMLPGYIRRMLMLDNVTVTMQPSISIIDSSHYTTIGIAGVVALAVLLGLFLLFEMINTRVRTDKDVEGVLQLPLIARVGRIRTRGLQPGQRSQKGTDIFEKVTPWIREEIQTLDNNIRFALNNKPLRSVIITSAQPGDGKSMVSVLLASCIAKQQKHVLLIDADFRNPTVFRILGCKLGKDMVEMLSKNEPPEEYLVHTSIPGLDILDSRNEAAAAFVFKSKEFSDFFENAKQEYDVVVFDTPPIGLFSETSQLASIVDATVVVMRYNKSRRNFVAMALDQLKKAKANVVGGLINAVDYKRETDYRYTGYYKYYTRKGRLKKRRIV